MKDLTLALKEGRVKEFFGSGTACVVCPVHEIEYRGERLHIPTVEQKQPVFERLMKELNSIQVFLSNYQLF